MIENTLDIYHFRNNKELCLTIGDIRKWETNKEYVVCMLDSNFEESHIWFLEKTKSINMDIFIGILEIKEFFKIFILNMKSSND